VRLLHDVECDLMLQQKQRWKLCSLYHIALIWSHQISTSLGHLFFLLGKRFEDQNILQKSVVQYFPSLGKEYY
jgi:hypothetical protein